MIDSRIYSFEQLTSDVSKDTSDRAITIWIKMLLDYEPPNLDIEIDEKLIDFMNKRKESFKDMDF